MTDTDVRRIEDKVDGLALAFARLEGSLSPTLQKLTDSQDDLEKKVTELETGTLSDHETRLRRIERWRYSIPTATGISVLIALATLLYLVLAHHSGHTH